MTARATPEKVPPLIQAGLLQAREIPELLPVLWVAIIRAMLFTIGKIFFPRLLHRERELRMRMRWVAAGFSVVLVVGVVTVIGYVHKTRSYSNQTTTPVSNSPSQPAAR